MNILFAFVFGALVGATAVYVLIDQKVIKKGSK